MRRSLLLFAIAVSLTTAGCSGGGDEPESSDVEPLSASELGWLRAYAAWTIAIIDGELGPAPGPVLVEVCRERLDETGVVPTERLERVVEHASGACPLLGRRGTGRRALDVIEESDAMLLPLLRETHEIPLETGVTDETRADVDLSAYATRRVERPVEVRCWDERDWQRVVHEDNAWSDDNSDPDMLYGWADYSADRVQMRLEQCNAVVELRETDVDTLGRERLIDSVSALGTLVHEVQHLVRPDDDEAEIECEVLFWLGYAAEDLGLNGSDAEKLARIYRTEVYSDQPEEYVTDDCDE